MKWNGSYRFLLTNLMQKDFRIRYRNMSLGVFWSLLNPLIMMAVLTFIFTKIFPNSTDKAFPLSILCGLVPFNFFALAWVSGSMSLTDNASLLKRVPVPREIFPIASVLSNCLHLAIQIALLLLLIVVFGRGVNVYWFWLPVLWTLYILFVAGLSLMFAALNVYVRDVRYVIESVNTVLFWLVPIFYSFAMIPARYKEIYQFNPVAALIMMLRNILLEGNPPAISTLWRMTLCAFGAFIVGLLVFKRLSRRVYDYL